jgi:dTDP-glucose 4,6-dehydratase
MISETFACEPHAVLLTGGAGFIGSHLVRRLVRRYPQLTVVNFDALTYAGNPDNLRDVENAPNYRFFHGDITDADAVAEAVETYRITSIIHLAAESHVDRSIDDPLAFARTNVIGTLNLLETARKIAGFRRFYHVSTDEVYGSLPLDGGYFFEDTPYDPRSPYSASKASSDHFVSAYGHTYGLPVVISNCSNNYGPNQYPEKLIPLVILNLRDEKPLPVYGKGINERDWLWVEDHADAMERVYFSGRIGQTYNVGTGKTVPNITVVRTLCRLADEKLGRPEGTSVKLMTFVTDRPGHDLRYAIKPDKIGAELGWKPTVEFERGLSLTFDWYLQNPEWIDGVVRRRQSLGR